MLNPGLPNLQLQMEEIETILFIKGPIHSAKFIKILSIRSTQKTSKTEETPHKGPMIQDPKRNPTSVLDQGQDPGGHDPLLRQEHGPQGPLVVLPFDPKLFMTHYADLTIQKFLPVRQMNPNRLRSLRLENLKVLTGEDFLKNVKKPTKMN